MGGGGASHHQRGGGSGGIGGVVQWEQRSIKVRCLMPNSPLGCYTQSRCPREPNSPNNTRSPGIVVFWTPFLAIKPH